MKNLFKKFGGSIRLVYVNIVRLGRVYLNPILQVGGKEREKSGGGGGL